MDDPNKKDKSRILEGHYDYYGIPAYILKQKNGAYASGFYDPVDGIFKAGGCVKKILWDGVKIPEKEAKKLIREYSRSTPFFEDEDGLMPEWILLPEEASHFMKQADELRTNDPANSTKTEEKNSPEKDFPGKNGELV